MDEIVVEGCESGTEGDVHWKPIVCKGQLTEVVLNQWPYTFFACSSKSNPK